MKRPALERACLLFVSCGFFAACAPMSHRFVPSDASFKPAPRTDPPLMLIDRSEFGDAPVRYVGVLEIRGQEHQSINTFLGELRGAGSLNGCEVVVQRDLFELGVRERLSARPPQKGGPQLLPFNSWRPSDVAVWQFYCGLTSPPGFDFRKSLVRATRVAMRMREEQLGEVCAPYMPTGSHIHYPNVCADAPGR